MAARMKKPLGFGARAFRAGGRVLKEGNEKKGRGNKLDHRSPLPPLTGIMPAGGSHTS